MKEEQPSPAVKTFRFVIDLIIFASSSFGGPMAHIALMNRHFVEKRKYVSSQQLSDIFSIAQMLPGPSSTQTLVGIAYLKGGYRLAITTWFVWIFPPAFVMYWFALNIHYGYFDFLRLEMFSYLIPVTIATIAAYVVRKLRKRANNSFLLFLITASFLTTLILNQPYVFPMLIFLGGFASNLFLKDSTTFSIRFSWLKNISQKQWLYFFSFLICFALLGAIIKKTSPFSLPIRLLENFYRNGIIVFGGGDALISLLYNEFVQAKQYLSSDSFLSAYAVQKILPGPTFSFTSFIGSMTMLNKGSNFMGALLGSVIAIVGINLPGFLLMIFVTPLWNKFQHLNKIKKTMDGIGAVIVGFIAYTTFVMLRTMEINIINISILIISFLIFHFTKISPFWVILGTLILGFTKSFI